MSTRPLIAGEASRNTSARAAAGEMVKKISAIVTVTERLTCGSATHYTIPHWEASCSVPLGLFPRIPLPEFELYASRKMEWLPNIEGVKTFDQAPTVALAGRDN
jgi:hypothetical protein